MFLDAYQKLAMRTSTYGHDRVQNGLLGLIGESGEIVDLIKKHRFQSTDDTPLPKSKLIEEIGDVLWYIAETLTGLGLTMEEVLAGRKPTYSIFHVYAEEMGKSLETAAALTANFATRCYIVRNFDQNIVLLKTCLYDTYCALTMLAELIGSTIGQAAQNNIEKLRKRYPDGFDPERSMNRAEYTTDHKKDKLESASEILFIRRNRTV